MARGRIAWLGSLLVLAMASAASAQPETTRAEQDVLGSPGRPGATPPVQGVDLTVEFVGGYDDNLEPLALAPTPGQPDVIRSGYTSVTTGTVRFGMGRRADKFLRGAAGGSLGYQQLGGDFETLRTTRGDVALQAGLPLGRRSGLLGTFNGGYEPAFLFGSFAPLAAQPNQSPTSESSEPVDVDMAVGPLQGVTRQRWLVTDGAAGAFRNWTSRQRMEVQFADTRRSPVNGIGLDSRNRLFRLRHVWNARPQSGLEFAYRVGQTSQTNETEGRTLDIQSVEARWRFTRRRSPTKAISVTLGGGADYTRAPAARGGSGYDNLSPLLFGSTRLDLTRTWIATADVRRQVTVLEGLVAEPFTTSAFALRLDGTLSRRLRSSFMGAYSVGSDNAGGPGSFTSTVAGMQLQYGLGRHLGLVADYSYYRHQLRQVALNQPFLPNDYWRNSVRVGLTVWLPVLGGL